MKLKYIPTLALALTMGLGFTSCEDFLDRPKEDGYNSGNFYQTNEQCLQGVNYLSNAPWYDFQRGFFCVGEALSGNYIQGTISEAYISFSLDGNEEQLAKMSASLWSVIAHSNSVYNNIALANGSATQAVKNQTMGECLTWKALAYFFLVRSFGEVPIIHDTSAELAANTYATAQKVKRADVYDYIIMTLEKAMELLPKEAAPGRLDYYSAEGLLAKTYLTKAGVSGTFNAADLDKAAEHARNVIKNSSYTLLDNYEDIFLLKNKQNREGMIVWRWTADGSNWTRQNSLQSDIGLSGLDDYDKCWGDWGGMTPDCQQAFGVAFTDRPNGMKATTPEDWNNAADSRLHATMMLPGFTYPQFLSDRGGFDYLKWLYVQSPKEGLQSPTGANTVKHIYGDTADHIAGAGCSDAAMASSVPTFVLRFSDMYLILAEAITLKANPSDPFNAVTTDGEALDAFYTVRHRAVKSYVKPAQLTYNDIWKERRLEFCMEGDRWYDFVRLSYVDPAHCKKELESQDRYSVWNLGDVYKNYFETGTWDVTNVAYQHDDPANYSPISVANMMKKDPDSGKEYFLIPPYSNDVVFNPNMARDVDGVHVDVRETYKY